MLTLNEFRNTGLRNADVSTALKAMGMDDLDLPEGLTAVWEYDGSTYILEHGETFQLYLAQHGFQGNRHDLEARLYFDWWASECQEERHTLSSLTSLLAEWTAWRGKTPASADAMMAEAAEASDVEWLGWFLREWEDAELRASGHDFRTCA